MPVVAAGDVDRIYQSALRGQSQACHCGRALQHGDDSQCILTAF